MYHILLLSTFLFISSSIVSSLTTIYAGNTTYVTPLGRSFPVGISFLGLSYLGSGFRINHTGNIVRATIQACDTNAYKLMMNQHVEGYVPFQGISWIPTGGLNETITIGHGSGIIDVIINVPPQYWSNPSCTNATIISITSDGEFLPSTPITRVLHFLGDSITASTNIRGGFKGCADGGYQSDYSSSWAGLLCSAFDASCSTIAVGGKGLVRNCCDNSTKMPDYYTMTKYTDSIGTFSFHDTIPNGFLIYLGTNDYSQGETPTLDQEFTAAFLQFMYNVTKVYYGTSINPANVTFFAVCF
jgi:hypothetical protein